MPADVSLFPNRFLYSNVPLALSTEGQYLTGTPMAPSTAAIPSDSQVRSQLQTYLHEQFGSDLSSANAASAIFSSPAVTARIPDTRLRAAFAALAGTSLAPAEQYFLDNAAYFTGGITFDALDSFKAPSETQRSYNGSTVGARVLINSRYQHEPWQLFTVLIGHELQHTQSQAVPVDEAITNFELTIEYTEILAKHPAMAYWDTELSRRLNGFAQLFLDSRAANSAQNAMIVSGGGGLFPGSNNPATDIWTDYHGGGIAPAPTVAQQVLAELLPGVPLPSPLKYSQDTAALFAQMADPYLPPTTRLQVSVLLQLITPAEIAKALGDTAQQATSTFNLQPYLDVIANGQHTPS